MASVVLVHLSSHAYAGELDLALHPDQTGDELTRRLRTEEIAGKALIGVGAASFGVGALTFLSQLPLLFGYAGCNAVECAQLDAKLQRLQIGSGVAMGLGAVLVLSGGIQLGLHQKQRSAIKRRLSVSVAPTVGGASANAQLVF